MNACSRTQSVKKFTCMVFFVGSSAAWGMQKFAAASAPVPSTQHPPVHCELRPISRVASPEPVIRIFTFDDLQTALTLEEYEAIRQIINRPRIVNLFQESLDQFNWTSHPNACNLLRHALIKNDIVTLQYLEKQGVRDSVPAVNNLIIRHKIKRAQNLVRITQLLKSNCPKDACQYIEKKHWYGTTIELNKQEFVSIMQCLARDGHTLAIRWLNERYPTTQRALPSAVSNAIAYNKTDTALYLLSRSGDISTCLHAAQLAAETNNVAVLQYILEKRQIRSDEISLLDHALKNGHSATVKYLCTRPQAKPHFTTIVQIALNKAKELHKTLVKLNMDINSAEFQKIVAQVHITNNSADVDKTISNLRIMQTNTAHLAQAYDDIVHFCITNQHLDMSTILEPMLAPGANKDAALSTIKYLIAVQRIPNTITDKAAIWAIAHGHLSVFDYLLHGGHVQLASLLSIAQRNQLQTVTEHLLNHYAM